MLVVDDQPIMETMIRRLFSSHEVKVVFATTAARAVELAREASPDLAIVDIYLGAGGSGIDLIGELRRQAPNMVIGAMSGQMHHELADACARAGASWSLEKPFDRDTLFATIVVHGGPPPMMLRVDLPLETVTTEYIQRVLDARAGNKSAAARVLGKTRQSLQRILKGKPD